MVCWAVSGSDANIAIPASEWPFLLNCLIVLVGQAGGSRSHLASGEKKKKVCTLTQCMGVLGEGDSIRHFTFSKLHIPLGRFQKVFGLDQDQVCAAIVSDVLC